MESQTEFNLIKLIKDLSLVVSKDLFKNDTLKEKNDQKKIVNILQKMVFDKIRQSDQSEANNFWYPEILIADYAYKLINDGEDESGYNLLESVSLVEKQEYLNLDEVWTFLLHLQNFEERTKHKSNNHPFSCSGSDFFFRDVNPYSLLPQLLSNADNVDVGRDGTANARNVEDLFLDLFIENNKKVFSEETGPILDDFIDLKSIDSVDTHKLERVRVSCATSKQIKTTDVQSPPILHKLQMAPVNYVLETEEILDDSSIGLENFEDMLRVDTDIFYRRKFVEKNTFSAVSDVVLGIYDESRVLRQLFDPSYELSPIFNISFESYVTQVKYLMCGVNSDLFHFDNTERKYFMKQGAYLHGISPDCLFEISKSFLEAGTCFKRVSGLAREELSNAIGILYPTFWRSIENFLVKYRGAVAEIASDSLMGFKLSVDELQCSMVAMNKLCSSKGGGHLPRGGLLLSHLYELCASEQRAFVQDVIFSILFDCSTVYASKLIEKWIFQGLYDSVTISEFFIKIDMDLSERQDRHCYQSISVDEQLVPCFMAGLAHSMYSSGKAVWLLKLFDPENSFIYFMESLRYPRVKICTTEEEFMELNNTFQQYEGTVNILCGGKETFLSLEKRDKEIEEERINNMKETQKKIWEILEKKKNEDLQIQMNKLRAKEQLLKDQLDAIAEKRERDKKAQLERDKIDLEQDNTMLDKHKVETARYYERMSEVAQQMKREADWQFKRLELHQKRVDFLKTDLINENAVLDQEGNIVSPDIGGIGDRDIGDDSIANKEVSDENSNPLSILNENEEATKINKTTAMTDETNNNWNNASGAPEENICVRHTHITEAQKNKLLVLGSEIGLVEMPKVEERSHYVTKAMRNKLKCLGNEYHFGEVMVEDRANQKGDLSEAERNKLKVLGSEYDFSIPSPPKVVRTSPVKTITEAMRNKMKVLSSEYQQTSPIVELDSVQVISEAMKNKIKMLSSDFSPSEPAIKTAGPLTEAQRNKLKVLSSEFDIPFEEFRSQVEPTNNELPTTDLAELELHVEPLVSTNTDCVDAPKKSAAIFNFEPVTKTEASFFSTVIDSSPTEVNFDSIGRDVSMFARYYQKSLAIALRTQESLANGALLKHFIQKESVMTHITCLRRYFLHYDGEFSRKLAHGMFQALYHCTEPQQFFDKSLLSGILNEALIHAGNNSQNLSFQIVKMPTHLNVQAHDILTPFQLSYLVKWPLNIIITDQTIDRYRKVFHILVNLKRVHWTLNETFLLLKTQTKDRVLDGKRLMNSPEYTKLATYRHAMTLFIMTLEEHVSTNGLQEAWMSFTKHLRSVEDLEQLYQAHVAFVKDISRRCFLAKATQDLLSYINELIELGLRFHYVLKSSRWRLINDAHYSHPKYDQLRIIFQTFCKITRAFNKTLRKKTQHADMKIHIPMLELIELKIKI